MSVLETQEEKEGEEVRRLIEVVKHEWAGPTPPPTSPLPCTPPTYTFD